MPQYQFTAVTPNGQRVRQVMTGNSKIEVANQLRQDQLFVLEITEVTAHKAKIPKSLKLTDKVFFTQNIATLLSSGMSLSASLSAISEDTEAKGVVPLYNAIRHDLEQGFPFSKALSRYPGIFDNVYTSLVEAGENSGKLEEVLTNLANRMEKDGRTAGAVKSALIYPSIIFLSLFILGGLIITFVLPKLIPVFTDLKVKLPITTRMLIALSKFMTHHTSLFFIVLAIIAVGGIVIAKSKLGKDLLQLLLVKTPVIRQIVVYMDLSRLSSTMALLLSAGVPIQKAITISSNTIRNPRLKSEITSSAQQLTTGTNLARSLYNSSLPRTFVALVGVGERSGNIDRIFRILGDHYENMLDTSVKNFTGLIEPVLTLFVGLVVGGTVLSIMFPIYSVVGNLSGGQ